MKTNYLLWGLFSLIFCSLPLLGQAPAQCEDVMLQGFYWDSNQNKSFGNTQWATLNAQHSELGQYFDLIWLPPSAKSSGGVGYIPTKWSDQDSDWGSAKRLTELIGNLQGTGCKVIADIVVNHRGNADSWCNFHEDNFGTYGVFQLTEQQICSGDEMWTSTSASAICKNGTRGGADTGDNYDAARDLDHRSSVVQSAVTAYMKWMKSEMGYDGWRYDLVKGFAGSYVDQYNRATDNYISVGECYDYSYDVCFNWVKAANYNSLVFDFPAKFGSYDQSTGINSAFKSNDLSKLIWQAEGVNQPAGLIHHNQSKRYSITFVDNHDTYDRGEPDKEFYPVNAANKTKILQANLFILGSPGIPCIFYPHWYSYKAELKPMVAARKAVGVHSESSVTVQATSTTLYAATIQGKYGELALKIGSAEWSPSGLGWVLAASGTDYAAWTKIAVQQLPRLGVSPVGGLYEGGTTVTLSATQGGAIYYTLDGSEPTAASTPYTAPIAINSNTTLKSVAVNAAGSSLVHTHQYVTSAADQEAITVKFKKPTSWPLVKIWAWNADYPTNIWGAGTTWPGVTMTDNGDGWWSYTFDKTIQEVNVIFNNGASSSTIQTGDVLDLSASTCYEFGGANKQPIVVSDCGLTSIVGTSVPSLQLYPNPVRELLSLTSDRVIKHVEIMAVTGEIVQRSAVAKNETTLSVSSLNSGMYLMRITLENNQVIAKRFIKH